MNPFADIPEDDLRRVAEAIGWTWPDIKPYPLGDLQKYSEAQEKLMADGIYPGKPIFATECPGEFCFDALVWLKRRGQLYIDWRGNTCLIRLVGHFPELKEITRRSDTDNPAPALVEAVKAVLDAEKEKEE